jgi:hypothetical protein
MIFSIQLGILIPTDELIFFRGVGQPPTSQKMVVSAWENILKPKPLSGISGFPSVEPFEENVTWWQRRRFNLRWVTFSIFAEYLGMPSQVPSYSELRFRIWEWDFY